MMQQKPKIKRTMDMSELEKAIVSMVWDDVKTMPAYSEWRKYERGFIFEQIKYRYKCRFKIEDGFLVMHDTSIEHETVAINLMH